MQAGVVPQPVLAHLNSGSEGGIEIGIEVWDSFRPLNFLIGTLVWEHLSWIGFVHEDSRLYPVAMGYPVHREHEDDLVNLPELLS